MTELKNISNIPTIKRDALIAFRKQHGDAKTLDYIAALTRNENLLQTSVYIINGEVHGHITDIQIKDGLKANNSIHLMSSFRLANAKGPTFEVAFTNAIDQLLNKSETLYNEREEKLIADGGSKLVVLSVKGAYLVIEP